MRPLGFQSKYCTIVYLHLKFVIKYTLEITRLSLLMQAFPPKIYVLIIKKNNKKNLNQGSNFEYIILYFVCNIYPSLYSLRKHIQNSLHLPTFLEDFQFILNLYLLYISLYNKTRKCLCNKVTSSHLIYLLSICLCNKAVKINQHKFHNETSCLSCV